MMKIISRLSEIHMLTRFLMILVGFLVFCTAMDTITFNNPLREGGETLDSAGGRFELAFFKPNGSNINNRYIGIRYKSNPDVVVWVANRSQPLPNGSIGVFAIADNGDLQVLDGTNNKSYWSTNLQKPSSKSARARLLDNGNLVLESEDTKFVWQSFDHPTDTFLPGMKMEEGFMLSSWKSQADPAVGDFTFQPNQDDEDQFIIWKGSSAYWKSGVSGKFIASDENIQLHSYLTTNFSTTSIESSYVESKSKTLNYGNIILRASVDYNNTRLVLNFEGLAQIFIQRNRTGHWIPIWQEPKDFCSLFDACGSFASCNINNQFPCKCLPGFKPYSLEKWNNGEFSEGCERISSMCDKNASVTTSFLKLKNVKVGKPDGHRYQDTETQCRDDCRVDCTCKAYSYSVGNSNGGTCWFWHDDIKNIQELYPHNGRDLIVSVAHSDIETSKRSCETCGTNIIPYPLSTGSQCGDPMYYGFVCDNSSTGQVFFKVSNGSYRVTSINAESQRFSIQVTEDCTARDWRAKSLPLDPSSPFFFRGCNMYDKKVRLNPLLVVNIFNEAEIQWNPPHEPLCNSTQDCNDLPHATCKRASDGMQRCQCNEHFNWDFKNVTCIKVSRSSKTKEIPYLSIFLGAIAAILLIICAIIYFLYLQQQRMVTRRESHTESTQSNITASRLYDSEKRVKEFIDSGQFKEEDKKGIDVPFIDLESILAATDDFSDANKLGQGGFGPVYKGKFPGGQEIAIKRLSSGSGQGLEEFKNEVVLIAKLQHRNLVRLLGYYVDRYEKMLLYEYMPNRSLDAFIFDRTLCVHLNWELRFNIIVGIARGLLYLHHDSRLRIIHRDLKTSNVLLDEEMTPKISDFGLARIFDGKQTEATTQRVVGTYGYMSPEYAVEGFFSIKSDVFSFGVVLLEILSGKRNTEFYKSEQALNLLGYAWRLWREQRALDLMDNAIRETCNESEFMRCVNVGLLCVQEDPNDRPTMSTVIFGLGSESATLPSPQEPAFIVKRSSLSGTTSSSRGGVLELTVTLEQGR